VADRFLPCERIEDARLRRAYSLTSSGVSVAAYRWRDGVLRLHEALDRIGILFGPLRQLLDHALEQRGRVIRHHFRGDGVELGADKGRARRRHRIDITIRIAAPAARAAMVMSASQ
jgi:hypothetical protein